MASCRLGSCRDHHPVGAAVMGERPVGAGEHGSIDSQAEQAVPVPVNSTDHVRGQRAAGYWRMSRRSAPTSGYFW